MQLTKCHMDRSRGGGSKIVQNSVKYYLNAHLYRGLPTNKKVEKLSKSYIFLRLHLSFTFALIINIIIGSFMCYLTNENMQQKSFVKRTESYLLV
jgi:hypothetical protein